MTRLLRNILANYAGSAVNVAVLFLLTPFVIHRLGNEAYAAWVLIRSIAFYLCFFDLGILDAIVKYAAEVDEDAEGNAELERLIGTALVLCAAAGVAALLTSVGLACALVPHLDVSPALLPKVQLVMLLLGAAAAIDFMLVGFVGLLEGRQRYDALSAVQIGGGVLKASGAVVLLSSGSGVVALALLEVVISGLSVVAMTLTAALLHPQLSFTPRRFDARTSRRLRRYSVWSLFAEIAAQGSGELDKLFIPIFLSLALLTPYSVACSIATAIPWLVFPVVKTFLPLSSALGARNDQPGLERLLVQGSRAALAVALPVVLALLFTAEPVIGNWVGREYVADAAPALRILLANVLVTAAFSPAVRILTGLARVRELFLLTVFKILLAALLIALTARSGGLPALAASLLVANAVTNLGFIVPLVCRTVGVPVRRYLWHGVASPLGATLPALGAAALLTRYWYPETWLALAFVGAAVGLLYVSTFVGLCISRTERRELFQSASRLLASGAS